MGYGSGNKTGAQHSHKIPQRYQQKKQAGFTVRKAEIRFDSGHQWRKDNSGGKVNKKNKSHKKLENIKTVGSISISNERKSLSIILKMMGKIIPAKRTRIIVNAGVESCNFIYYLSRIRGRVMPSCP